MKTNKPIYTIHAATNKHIFIWLKNDNTGKSVLGRNLGTNKYVHELSQKLSNKLTDKLMNWTTSYIAAAFGAIEDDGKIRNLDIDWDQFNDEGMEIAREMKMKLGDKVTVQYLKSKLDPSKDMTPMVIE